MFRATIGRYSPRRNRAYIADIHKGSSLRAQARAKLTKPKLTYPLYTPLDAPR